MICVRIVYGVAPLIERCPAAEQGCSACILLGLRVRQKASQVQLRSNLLRSVFKREAFNRLWLGCVMSAADSSVMTRTGAQRHGHRRQNMPHAQWAMCDGVAARPSATDAAPSVADVPTRRSILCAMAASFCGRKQSVRPGQSPAACRPGSLPRSPSIDRHNALTDRLLRHLHRLVHGGSFTAHVRSARSRTGLNKKNCALLTKQPKP